MDDKKFYLETPDPNFSPARNKAVIEGTIKKYNEMREKKKHAYDDAYAERADAVVSYLRTADKKPGYALEKFFEPKYLAYLRGEEIRKKLMAGMTILDKKGKDITNHYI